MARSKFLDGYATNNGWRPISPNPRQDRPVQVMADVINNLGVRMLDCYVEQPGNIAFSPTGLTFVLAALYEGSAGRGNRQIGHCLGFPRDRRVTRIGLRDIHRRLRVSFTRTKPFEKILFYLLFFFVL